MHDDGQHCRLAAAIYLLLIGALACTTDSEPPEKRSVPEVSVSTEGTAFLELAADLIVEHGLVAIDMAGGSLEKTIVIDTGYFWPDEAGLLGMITDRFEREGISWQEVDLGRDPRNMPGQWENSPRSGFRINRSHVLLSAGIESEGEFRTLSWSYSCGELCSRGKKIRFVREENSWVQEQVTLVYS